MNDEEDHEDEYMQELQQNFEQNLKLNGGQVAPKNEYIGQVEVENNPEEEGAGANSAKEIKQEATQPVKPIGLQIPQFDVNRRLKENYERYCHIRYKEIITKRPDLMANTDLVTKIIVEEWEKKGIEEKLYIDFDAMMHNQQMQVLQDQQKKLIPSLAKQQINLSSQVHSGGKRSKNLLIGGAKPKKAMHPYLFFVKENRAQIGRDNQGKSFKELMSITSQSWAMLNPEQKARYEQMAAEDKIRHIEEMK